MFLQLYVNFMQTTPPLPGQDQVDSGFGYVIAAYAVIWLLIFGYIYSLNRRQARLRHDIEILKAEEAERQQQVTSGQVKPNPQTFSSSSIQQD